MNIQLQTIPSMYASFMNTPVRVAAPAAPAASAAPAAATYPVFVPMISPFGTDMDVLTISPEAQTRYDAHVDAMGGVCNTCATRVYVCSDGGVSRPTPGGAAAYVVAHERAHLAEDRAEAHADGNRVVSQSMSIFSATCPECGIIYVSGGEARSTIASETRVGGAVPEGMKPGCAPGGACCGCGCCGTNN